MRGIVRFGRSSKLVVKVWTSRRSAATCLRISFLPLYISTPKFWPPALQNAIWFTHAYKRFLKTVFHRFRWYVNVSLSPLALPFSIPILSFYPPIHHSITGKDAYPLCHHVNGHHISRFWKIRYLPLDATTALVDGLNLDPTHFQINQWPQPSLATYNWHKTSLSTEYRLRICRSTRSIRNE